MTKHTPLSSKHIFDKIRELLIISRQKITQNVNIAMTYTYFEIGKIIVEDEQKGKERAAYGKQVLKNLSKKLTQEFGKGFSERSLKNMRNFYIIYQNPSRSVGFGKGQTLSAKSKKGEKASENIFSLSWSHYVFLTI